MNCKRKRGDCTQIYKIMKFNFGPVSIPALVICKDNDDCGIMTTLHSGDPDLTNSQLACFLSVIG